MSVLAMVVLIVLISFTSRWINPWGQLTPFGVTGQAFLVICVLRFFCYWPPMVTLAKRMPVPHRVIFGLIVGGMILGHFTLKSRDYFPFVAWCIFPSVREEDPVTCPEFIATTESGRKVRLLAEQLFPSIVQIFPLGDPQYYPPEKTEDLVYSLAKVYNEHHADDPVRQVDLMVMAVELHLKPSESRAQPSCELLHHYEISSGQ